MVSLLYKNVNDFKMQRTRGSLLDVENIDPWFPANLGIWLMTPKI